jgi:hypothetical protein
MWKRRIAWIIIILSAAVMYLFSNETVTLAVLIVVVLAPLASLAILSFTGKHLEVSVTSEDNPEGGKSAKITMHNPDILPVADAEMSIRCTNLRTGETDYAMLRKSVPAKRSVEEIIDIEPRHVGRHEMLVESVRIFDPLGMWRRSIPVEGNVRITKLPELFDIQLSITSSAASMPESDRYAQNRKGNDPGEVLGIREYVPGDSVKNIHWKLSSKVDKMLVKELGMPITDQFLVVLDTASDVGLDPDALDTIASVYSSFCGALHADSMDFSMGWTDPETGTAVVRKVSTEEDLISCNEDYLAVPAITRSAFEKIERGVIDSRFAHLVIVSSRIPEGIESITNGCQVMLLLYGAYGSIRTSDGVEIVGFDRETYRSELAGIEV